VRELGIPSLRTYGVTSADAGALCAKAAKASSMRANPIELVSAELEEILLRAI